MASLTTSKTMTPAPQPPTRLRWRPPLDWVGLLPFFAFIAAFLLFPALTIIIRSFTTPSGVFTLSNIEAMNQPVIYNTYITTLNVSLVTAISGGLLGFALAWAISLGGLPRWIRTGIVSFSGVAANFAGVPLVFAFLATLGRQGILNKLLAPTGIFLDPQVLLFGVIGLCIIYTYFQIPLMVLIVLPALEGLRKEWREAAENLGATRAQYWRRVAFPILLPSILGSMALLFANAFATHATAVALLGGMGSTAIVTVLIGNQFRTDTFGNPGLGYALALGMIVVIGITIMVYTFMRRRSERWLAR